MRILNILGKFLSKLGSLKSRDLQYYILEFISVLSEGVFTELSVIPIQGLSYMAFFKYKLASQQNLNIVVCVHLERYPEIDKNTNKVYLYEDIKVYISFR